ncbi:OLC1v1025105C1 [Oldenlandia corymbosa var. corymbosa]|uniref:OLC1v1025105C1 n=1 Tax=Oldenlandia corymbosa var. corymbosa TaxID=529605 RepID=A0AAV1C5C7_OLDCO|nr:OLC1v1025105C1 [Oldenlandia corymbosa var. corymbosa]
MAEQPAAKRSAAPPTTLNDLPQSLLIHTLSFLPILSAIETCYISRKWRNLWHSLPSLKFDITNFESNFYNSTVPEYHQRFAEFITQALLNRPTTIPLRDFGLNFFYSYEHRHRSLVTFFIRYPLDCNVDVVDLDFSVKNRSVKRLSLCRRELVIPCNDLIRFESIRVLEFYDVEIADESLSELIMRCQNHERLSLDDLRAGERKFRVISDSLKHLQLSQYFPMNEEERESSIEICTPNLSSINICHFYVANYSGDLSSVVEARVLLKQNLHYS